MLRSLFRGFIKLVSAVMPCKLISTFLGIGHLPAWQEHWASLVALLISHTFCYMILGALPVVSAGIAISGMKIAPFFLQVATCLLFLGTLAIFVVQNSDRDRSDTGYSDIIVIQIVFGQLLTAAVSMPAEIAVYKFVAQFYDKICSGVFLCPLWFNYFMHLLIFFVIPFVFFNLVIIIKPWPISLLQLRYDNCISIMFEGLVTAFYSTLIMYTLAFVCFGLTIPGALRYCAAIFRLTFGNGIRTLA